MQNTFQQHGREIFPKHDPSPGDFPDIYLQEEFFIHTGYFPTVSQVLITVLCCNWSHYHAQEFPTHPIPWLFEHNYTDPWPIMFIQGSCIHCNIHH